MALLSLMSLLHWKGQHLQVTCIVSRLTNVWWISLKGISTVRRFAAMVTKQSSGVSAQTLDKSQLLRMYEQMDTIREFEERARTEFADGKIPGFVHLYAGEEAVAVGVCTHLTDKDYITSTHRGHGHCIAKGVDVDGMAAELMGKQTGLCKGKGGSMHVADVDKGMLGANGIVGGGYPLACGAAL